MLEPDVLSSLEAQLVSRFFDQDYNLIESELPIVLEAQPDWLNGWKILSDTLLIQGKDASAAAKQALRLNYQDAKEHVYYGLVLKRAGDLAGAKAAFEFALALSPSNVAALNNLGIVEKDSGQIEKGIQCFQQALKRLPTYHECHSNLLFCLSHYLTSPKALFKEHQAYSRQFELPYIKQWPMHQKANQPDKVIKVGFVSADFREHSIATCFEPLLNQLSRDNTVSLYAYYNQSIVDETTKRLQSHFTVWRKVDAYSDDELFKCIIQDDIDVLIDLSGHTADNRLTVFTRKPAPIQISWFGYLATTGLKAMDYYFCDPYLAPPNTMDAYFTEKLVQLPVNALFQPISNAPSINAMPAMKNGYLTFGSFHRASKISEQTIQRWVLLLKALPSSRLMLAGMDDQAAEQRFISAFEFAGIQSNRLQVHPRTNLLDYLALHHQVDVCLDTFPSSGITPALYAAWMGVPTLCEAASSLTGRGAMAIMAHLDIKTMIGQDWNEVVAIAKQIEHDKRWLSDVRESLRERFKASALMNAQLQSDAFSNAIREMWQRWLKRKSNRSFQIN